MHARGLPGKNRKGFNIKLLPLLLTSGLILTQVDAAAADLTMALGGFDVSKEATAMGQVEYRFSTDWSGFRPQAGLFATADSGVYVYAGIGYPVAMSEKWSLIPSLSGGYYSDGAGKDLGHDVEFYSQLRLEYRLSTGAGIGLGVGHISNAGVGDKNPGAETACLICSVSF
jgi:lipid A 3-O-deacylase